ncbi:unnamed protein product [Linum tenue]|uniref:Uncharacterized protein n=1 Tax=Linum tenue TaxID=586396 RepID=A0AAV0H3S6_9ROSI|nr:unnamed protein product [Linum tenue]
MDDYQARIRQQPALPGSCRGVLGASSGAGVQ